MLLRKLPVEETSGAEVGVPQEVCAEDTGSVEGRGVVRAGNTPEIARECGVVFLCVGGRKGLLPTPDEFPRFEGGRKPDSWDGSREPGKSGDRLGLW